MNTSQNGSGDAAEQAQVQVERLMSRSATDPIFRAKLLHAPREALAEFSGRDLPANLDIRFVENTASATFVLPDVVDPTAELSNEELEAVAGGSELSIVLGTIALAIETAHLIKTIGDDHAWFS